MTNKEFNEKWDDANYASALESTEKLHEYITDCFDMYETEGFADTFESPYDQFKQYNGLPFKVVERCTELDFDLDALPAWKIEFEGGIRIDALPEEICKIEREG